MVATHDKAFRDMNITTLIEKSNKISACSFFYDLNNACSKHDILYLSCDIKGMKFSGIFIQRLENSGIVLGIYSAKTETKGGEADGNP